MATKNSLVTIRKRKFELKLTFEFADHIMNNYINFHNSHPLSFLQIQKVAKKCNFYNLHNRTYIGEGSFDEGKYKIVVILDGDNGIVKTCFKI